MGAALEVKGARYRFGDTHALDGVDMTVSPGECVALLGPNGAGKTTLVNLAVGLLSAQEGTVLVAGGDPRQATTRRALGVVQQSAGFPRTLKVAELVSGAAVRAGAKPSAAGPIMAEVGLSDLTGRRAQELSGGQRQRVQLAMALVAEPQVLVMDEPTVGLDVAARQAFWDVLTRRRARGAGILLTTHQISEARALADRVVVLHAGRVRADATPRDLVDQLPDRRVTCRTTIPAEVIRAWPDVLAVEHRTGVTDIATTQPEDVLRMLFAADWAVSDLRVEGAGLEEAVARLTTSQAVAA